MYKNREILRLRLEQGRTVRQTARATGASIGVVSAVTHRAKTAGVGWEDAAALSDVELDQRLHPKLAPSRTARAEPDAARLHVEMSRPGVTLELLHLEYLAEYPEGFRYTAFCDRYRRWRKRRAVWMRQVHRAGEKAFVDFSGKRPKVVDPDSGEVRSVELFVGVLGASNYSYVEAVETQRIEDWIGANGRMLAYFGGVPEQLVPDQLRSAVSSPSRDEPGIQRTFAAFARHHGTAIVPARPRRPKDKAKAEVTVQIAQRWILARIRNETFFSLSSLNERIRGLLEDLNDRPMRHYGGASRRQLFERVERAELSALPTVAFTFSEWKQVRVNLDYHVEFKRHYYSVPYSLVHERLELRATSRSVELFQMGERVAVHVRDDAPYAHTTLPAHMPVNHKTWLESDPGEVLAWATSVGPFTETYMRRLLEEGNPVPQQRWRSARGLKRVGEKYGADRVEAACEKALRFGGRSYKAVERMLRLGREDPGERTSRSPIEHDNVRGPDAFDIN